MHKRYFTYIATNFHNTVLYAGVTDNIRRRMYEHEHKMVPGFTAKYNINKLVWHKELSNPTDAISAEKKIKGWTRNKKLSLIRSLNPDFRGLLD